MSPGTRTTLFLLLLALVAGGVLLALNARGTQAPPEDDLLDGALDDTPKPAPADDEGEVVETPVIANPKTQGIPRILPPDAAIEDVRDALAIADEGTRHGALRDIYGSIGRIAQAPRILQGLQRHVLLVEDARVRGVTYAALGANTSGTSHAWLAGELAKGRGLEARVGALLGLAYAKDGDERTARSLGGLPHRIGSLPKRADVRDGLKTLVPLLEGDAARDALPVLRASLTAHADWYASLGSAVETLEAKLGG